MFLCIMCASPLFWSLRPGTVRSKLTDQYTYCVRHVGTVWTGRQMILLLHESHACKCERQTTQVFVSTLSMLGSIRICTVCSCGAFTETEHILGSSVPVLMSSYTVMHCVNLWANQMQHYWSRRKHGDSSDVAFLSLVSKVRILTSHSSLKQ